MRQYLELCKDVLDKGLRKDDRTGVGTISTFGYQMRFDLNEGFPIVTTKKVHLKSVIYELLWFINGDTNIKYLVDNGVSIWNDWPFEKYKNSCDYNGETMKEFALKIKESEEFAIKYGDLGPVYGKQWRDFNGEGIDQLANLVEGLKTNPYSRRHILCAWNPAQVDQMSLPPCHSFIQFYVSSDNKLSCQLYQRSADIFLGVPFNISSYALMTMMLAQVCNLELGDFVHTIGDAHIYSNHLEQIELQLSREPMELPTMKINPNVTSIFDFKYEDFELEGYESHPGIKGKVAV